MCLICGGPHYTYHCPNQSGDSTCFSSNSFLQPQPYQNFYPSPHQSCDPSFAPSSLMENLQNTQRMQEVASKMLRDSMEPSNNSYPVPYHSYNETENPSLVSSILENLQNIRQMLRTENQHVDPFHGSFCGPHWSEDCTASPSMESLENIQRMQEAAGQMLRESMNQRIDPFCGSCGGPHWSKDCPTASRRPVPMIWDDEWDLNQGDAVEIEGQGMEVAEDPAREPELSVEGSETIMDISVPPPIQQKEQEEKDQENPQFIIDCTWDNDLIDQKLAEWKKSKGTDDETERKESEGEFPDEKKSRFIIDFTWNDEEINEKLAEWKKLQTVDDEAKELEEEIPDNPELSEVESETKTDYSVPPPVQQDPTLNWYATPYSYGPEPIDDNFWSEDEGGIVEEMKLEMPDYSAPPGEKEVEEELPVKMKEEEQVPSWEEEFGDELVNLPTLIDGEVFDPVGDLAELEALMEGKPTMELKESPKEEVEEVVEEEEHHSWPVVIVGNEPHNTPKLRERAKRKRKPEGKGHLKRHVGFTEQNKKSLTFTRESSHYMRLIKFAPGKFDYWWPDPFKKLKSYCKSTKVNLFKTILDRAELNGLDRVQIKEKPPDEI